MKTIFNLGSIYFRAGNNSMKDTTNHNSISLYEAILNGLPEGIILTFADHSIVFANNVAIEFLNTTLTELVGRHIQEVITGSPELQIELLKTLSVENINYHTFRLRKQNIASTEPFEMLRIISEATAPFVGGDFFKSLAYHVIRSTGIQYAIITECTNLEKTRSRTLVYIEREHFLDNFEYDLAGTPCEIVMKGEDYYCNNHLETFFREDEGVTSYFGVPIFLSSGEVIGHIAVFDTKPMTIDREKLNILKIFASRAGAEIERKRKDEQLEGSMIRYQGLFEDSPIGLSEVDFSHVKKYIDSLKEKYKDGIASIYIHHPEEITQTYQKVKHLNVNKSLFALFDCDSELHYLDHFSSRITQDHFHKLIVTYDHHQFIFEQEVEIQTAKNRNKILKIKSVLLPGSEMNWSKSLISYVDITEQKQAESELKNALEEVKKLTMQLEAENVYLQQEIKLNHNFEEIVSTSNLFKLVLMKIQQVAETDATVLILGESGTGKELIARAIHSISNRSQRPLVKVNCAALPAALIESELFGHEKGAFTGALTQKIGRFELAHGGTMFLDEIGEMPIELQSKLLRVLQEGEFERVGSSKTIRVDVRIIAATNRNLEASINNKEFRADLYYRLNVFPIHSSALRHRKEDIPVLVNHFCQKYARKFNKKVITVSKQVLETLINYDWPGNVRELENIIERGMIISTSTTLEAGDWLPQASPATLPPIAEYVQQNSIAPHSLLEVEKKHIMEVLIKTNWKIRGSNGAAKFLNINPTTLEAKMKRLGIIRKPASQS